MKKSYLAYLMFLLAGSMLVSCNEEKKEDVAAPKEATRPVVTLGRLTEGDFSQYLTLKGTLEPKNKAVVSSRVGGTLKKLCVEQGDTVQAGQVLFMMEDTTYRNEVAVAKATLAAQEAAVLVAKSQVEKAQAQLAKAKVDKERFARLFDKKMVTANEVETYGLNYEAALADCSLAKSNVVAQEAQVALVKASLAIAEKKLDDCVIKAPISGKVSGRFHDPGEEIGSEEKVYALVDSSQLRAVSSLPSEHYGVILPGKSHIVLKGANDAALDVTVTDKTPAIEEGLRTFQIRALFDNPDDSWIPGQLVDCSILLKRSHGFGVARDIPVRRAAGILLYTVVDGKAKALPIQEGIIENGMMEVTGEGLSSELPIIVEGQYMISDGAAVQAK